MNRLKDKVALIAGGASGIGRSAAMLMAQEGASVAVADVNDDGGASVVASIEQTGGKSRFFHLDVRSEDDWSKAVDGALNTFGRLDVLVNSAGILIGGSVEEATLAEWRETLAGLTGAWGVVQTPGELCDDSAVTANGYLAHTTTMNGLPYALPTNPVQFDEQHVVPPGAPEHGQHTEEVLMDAGMAWDVIEKYKQAGAIL